MLKRTFITAGILLLMLIVSAQEENLQLEGRISYVTSQNVYIKFSSTEGISVGDTLFILKNKVETPALVVSNLSSISCVGKPLKGSQLKVDDRIIFRKTVVQKPEPGQEEVAAAVLPVVADSVNTADTSSDQEDQNTISTPQDIHGKVSISSYTNFSNTPGGSSQRMRYTFSFKGHHLGNSKLSVESYMSFIHRNNNWDDIQKDIFNGLKVYNLSATYDFNESTRLILGRKINYRISNIGAVDGIQFEKQIKDFYVGAIAGSRPDYENYSYNFNLFQYGVFAGHQHQSKNGNSMTTIAYVEQMNDWNTDRRFVYLQHSNSLVKNLHFFGTVEFDLYKAVVNPDDSTSTISESTFNMTNLYLMLRYRVIKNLSFTLSYSNRQNVIYYETYKNYLDRLLDNEALQGFRFRVNYRPIRYMSVGVTTGYRYRPGDPQATTNVYGYITYSRIPAINVSATLSATYLQTSYLSGNVYSLSFSRDIVPGKLYGGLAYRYVNYDYVTSEMNSLQNIIEANLSWSIYKKLSLSVYYEGTFDHSYTFNRIYANLTQRF